MSQINRLPANGLIERGKTLAFRFNGQRMLGHPGDTLASALLANGQKLVGRSFKYHRPRGILTAGSEEPNALVEVGQGAYQEPNTRATAIELYDGLSASSQNHRGSLEFDLMAITDVLSPFLSAGFYYKTFMWPKSFWERFYEPAIRSSAGLGRLSQLPDPDCYDHGYLHCDILVIGGGPAGLAAALHAGRSGARVIIADEDFRLGGRLNAENLVINGAPAQQWVRDVYAELQTIETVRILKRATAYGAYDDGIYGIHQRLTDHLSGVQTKPRHVLWRVYAQRTILCAGATERPVAFGNNDRPGIMMAGAVRAYANRWAVRTGERTAIFTNNDSGWQTALDLSENGVDVTAIIDTRNIEPLAHPAGAEIILGGQVLDTKGRKGITSILLTNGRRIAVDCLAVSGGWNPNVHLTCHHRGRPVWQDNIAAFVPGQGMPGGMSVAGAANGVMSLSGALSEGVAKSQEALSGLGIHAVAGEKLEAEDEACAVTAFWHVAASRKRAWLDFQNDVTVKDMKLALQEGFHSVELYKRYTTLGMATDQGKTANVSAIGIVSDITGKPMSESGTTIFRPPYSPVPIAAFAGRSRGKAFRPYRLTPSHKWAEENDAAFVESGSWLRAQWFAKPEETHWRESVDREVMMTRGSAGICDVSTLGKIDIQGRDASEFLNRVYANGFANLAIGKVRYGLMLREDGLVMDDGTTARLGPSHYVMTTSTANAADVFRHLEFCRQCLWPDLDVHLVSVTDGWAQFAVAGPNSRKLLRKVLDGEFNLSNDAFPFMACAEVSICGGTQARLFRISFSGELAYEIAVPSRYGDALIRSLMKAGREFDAVPYGVEALNVMRVEKGHAAGGELNGQTTARDLGLERMVSKKKDCIGNTLSERAGLNEELGFRLMGFRPVDRSKSLIAGAHFINRGEKPVTANDQGWLTSAAFSPELGYSIGLGFIKAGHERVGEIVQAVDFVRNAEFEVEIVSPSFIDPKGERARV